MKFFGFVGCFTLLACSSPGVSAFAKAQNADGVVAASNANTKSTDRDRKNTPTRATIEEAIRKTIRNGDTFVGRVGDAWEIKVKIESVGEFDEDNHCLRVHGSAMITDGSNQYFLVPDYFRLTTDGKGHWKAEYVAKDKTSKLNQSIPKVVISASEAESLLLVKIAPTYPQLLVKIAPTSPQLARLVKISETVVLRAEISKDGTIQNLQLISGHPMLVSAAIEAVKQWRYKPYLLNGEPVEVETTVNVVFAPGGGKSEAQIASELNVAASTESHESSNVPASGTPAPQGPAASPAELLKWVFVSIPAGEFEMGCSPGDTECFPDEKPCHRVRIAKSFEIGKYPVTQAMWESVMGNNPSHFQGPDRPVEQVSWDDVQEFLAKLNSNHDGYHYRLPTEAEWEYAARAGTTGARYGDLGAIAWYGDNSGSQQIDSAALFQNNKVKYASRLLANGNGTHPVGQLRPNAWGLYDMLGNVLQWVQDWYAEGYYQVSPANDPPGPSSGRARGLRGGSWISPAAGLRVSARGQDEPGSRNNIIAGFRCVRTVVP